MKKELEHIDLIDKFLSGNLNPDEQEEVDRLLSEDKEFAKEIEVFRQIYQGVERQSKDKLKAKLHEFYQEHLEEEGQAKKPRGLYRRLIIFSSAAAACVLIGTLFYMFNPSNDLIQFGDDTPNMVNTDTLGDTPKDSTMLQKNIELAEEEPNDSTSNSGLGAENDVQLAFSNTKEVPAESVRLIQYPPALFYTFHDKKLNLYGNPNISGLQLLLAMDDAGHYFLIYNESLYPLQPTTSKTKLTTIQNPYTLEEVEKEDIEVQVASIMESSVPHPNLTVRVKDNSSLGKEYSFFEKTGKKHLIIDANMELEKITVVVISKKDGESYYLIHGKTLYQLKIGKAAINPLEEMDFAKNNETRMLVQKPSFLAKVHQIRFQD